MWYNFHFYKYFFFPRSGLRWWNDRFNLRLISFSSLIISDPESRWNISIIGVNVTMINGDSHSGGDCRLHTWEKETLKYFYQIKSTPGSAVARLIVTVKLDRRPVCFDWLLNIIIEYYELCICYRLVGIETEYRLPRTVKHPVTN